MKALLRPSISTLLVVFFFFILLFLGIFAEVFESQAPEVDLAQIYANPIPVDELQHLGSLRITNKHGSFVFQNTHPEGLLVGPWQMMEPQSLRMKDGIVTKIVDALNVIRVRNLHRDEPINVTSFSLDNPTLTLQFTTTKNKAYDIKVGLINPIDNSAYLSLSSQNQIYQIDPMEMALESYDLSHLVESKVLALNLDSLAAVEIYKESKLLLKLLRKDDSWVDQNGSALSATKVQKFFEKIEDMKSSKILENLSTEQKEFMDKVMAAPLYTLKLISNQGLRNYLISELASAVPGTDNVGSGSYVLSSDERKSFILMNKDQFKIFNVKPNELK